MSKPCGETFCSFAVGAIGPPCVSIETRETCVNFSSIYSIVLLIISLSFSIGFTAEDDQAAVTYYAQGGIRGSRTIILLYENGVVHFDGSWSVSNSHMACRHVDTVNSSLLKQFLNRVQNPDILSLDSLYPEEPRGCKDGMTYYLKITIGKIKKTIMVEGCREMPPPMKLISEEFLGMLKTSWKKIECGTLYPNMTYYLLKWPFSSHLSLEKLFDSESKSRYQRMVVKAPACVVAMFDKIKAILPERLEQVRYHENGYIYEIYSSYFQRRRVDRTIDTVTLEIVDRQKPRTFLQAVTIDPFKIPQGGIHLEGEIFKQVFAQFDAKGWGCRFVKQQPADNDFAYLPYLALGNKSQGLKDRFDGSINGQNALLWSGAKIVEDSLLRK
jgi:hypothetical protein